MLCFVYIVPRSACFTNLFFGVVLYSTGNMGATRALRGRGGGHADIFLKTTNGLIGRGFGG